MATPDIASGALGFFTSTLKDATKASVAIGGELLSGTQKLGAYSAALTGNSNMFTKAIGTVVDGLIKFSESSLEEYQTLTAIGATFGKELSQVKIAAAELGVSVADMTKIIQQNSSALRTFGGTTDQAINRFRAFSKNVLDSELGTELRRLGYTAADINETLLVYQELALQDGNMQRMSAKQQAESARNFAVELDGLAKLTGIQREELANEMKERRRQGDVQAFLMGQSAEVQENFMLATQKISSTMGPQFSKLFQDLLIRGAPITEETRNAFIALGGSADEFEATVANFRQGMNTQNFDQFNQSLIESQGAFADNLKTQEARDIAMLGGLSPISEAMGQAYQSSYDFANSLDAAREGNESAAATLQRLQTQITEEQAVQMANTNNLLDKTIQLQETLRDFTIAATTEVLPRLETMAVQGIDMFIDKLPTSDQIAQQLGGAVENLFSVANAMEPYREQANAAAIAISDTLINSDLHTNDTAANVAGDLGARVDGVAPPIVEALTANAVAAQAEAEAVAARQETAQAALDDANARLVEAEAQRAEAVAASEVAAARLADLTTQGFDNQDPMIRQAQDEATRAASEAERAASIAEATQRVVSSLQGMAAGRPFRGFADGGDILPGEVGMVGEEGVEFITGPANITSAKESSKILGSLTDSIFRLSSNITNIKDNENQNSLILDSISRLSSDITNIKDNENQNSLILDSISRLSTSSELVNNNNQLAEIKSSNADLVSSFMKTAIDQITETQTGNQEQITEMTSQLTTNNDREFFTTLNKNVEKMVGLLNILVNVESNAVDIAGRTFRATRSLNGNMLKGVNV